jgi:hypothetical protein
MDFVQSRKAKGDQPEDENERDALQTELEIGLMIVDKW